MPLVRADGEGYTYAGAWVDGFADRPELPLPVRVRLARLGERYAPRKLSAAQRDLLASRSQSETRHASRPRSWMASRRTRWRWREISRTACMPS
jgi:hypothetical protein